jgi:hypothetical protein
MSKLPPNKLFLVGDNPFLNISHLSQQKARERIDNPADPIYAAKLLRIAMDNGANGFTFSVCENNFVILKNLQMKPTNSLGLYPVVPYAFEYVQKATQQGGMSGLVKSLGWDMVKSGNIKSLFYGITTLITGNPKSLLKAYISFELTRLLEYTTREITLESMLLHQLVTDMALALDMDWLFKEYIGFLKKKNIVPGFNTGNFVYLIKKFKEWHLSLGEILILAPFNKVGFQMTPSVEECEVALRGLPISNVIAISVLAAGFVKPKDAAEYIATLPSIRGVAIGVSKSSHAKDTFSLFEKSLKRE